VSSRKMETFKEDDGIPVKSSWTLFNNNDLLTIKESSNSSEISAVDFDVIDEDSLKVDLSHYYELDSEVNGNSIQNDHTEDDSTKIDMEEFYFEDEKHLIKQKNNHGKDIYDSEKRIIKQCPSCEQEFNVSKSSYKLVCHIRLDHHDEDLESVIEELQLGDKGRVVCQICGETKTNKYVLATHIKTIHEEAHILVPCHICGKLLRQNSMYSHLKSHCENKVYARNHMETHEQDLEIMECKTCRAKFSGMTRLKKHQRNVHLRRKAKCDVCEKMFSNKSKMNRHQNSVHVQEKQFSCEYCGNRSSRKDNLNDHIKRCHGKNDCYPLFNRDVIPLMPEMEDSKII